MKKSGGGADNSFGPPLVKRPVWDTEGPDHECECPGPPPEFYLPPPPRPSSLVDSECSDTSVSLLETCKALPVIDSEYHYSPVTPSVAIVLTATAAVVVFLFIGTFLVFLKKKKMRESFPRKSSPSNRRDEASANGVIYEDLTDVPLSRRCLPGQTTLPPIEMLDVASYPDYPAFTPGLICPTSPALDPYNSQDLFNPVYEELSNGSGDRGEVNASGEMQAGVSDDDFAEDELSLGGEDDDRGSRQEDGTSADRGKEVDGADADDRSRFLANSSLPPYYREREREREKEKEKEKERERRSCRGSSQRPKTLDRRKLWRNKAPPLPAPPADYSEFHEGFLLKKILQIYPDVTGVTFQYPRESEDVPRDERESLTRQRRPKPDIFSTFGAMRSSGKNQSQEAGADSGCSSNPGTGKSLARSRRDEYRIASRGNAVLS